MRYYVYFDGYGHPKRVINENELAEKHDSDPQQFLKAACGLEPGARIEDTTGHVGTLTFDSEKELREYLDAGGDEITVFYECESDCRPYNF